MAEEMLVPPQHWEDLKAEDIKKLCDHSQAIESPPNGLILSLLGREIRVDRNEASLKSKKAGSWEKVQDPLLELLILVYLLKVGPDSLQSELISVQELKTAHFFQGPHELRLGPLLDRYGQDAGGFKRAAESLGGEALGLADVSYSIPALPKVPLYYLLWEGDEEFEPRVSVLFDRSVENHLSGDAIWGLVNLVSEALVKAPGDPF
jgi:hypothetical protein